MFPHQRISFIHSKVNQIHAQLMPSTTKPPNDPELGGIGNEEGRIGRIAGLAKKLVRERESFCCCLRKQLFCAQCLKLLALFTVAIIHVLFLHPFLEFFSQLEEYSNQVDMAMISGSRRAAAEQIQNPLRPSIHDLADYKKNVWMTVAVLCIALSTSSFFLFLLPSSSSPIRKSVLLVGFIDAISFACLPFLFSTRASIVQQVQQELGHSLVKAHKMVSAEKLMNEVQCSIQPREKMSFCSDLILRSVFPVDLLKFLLILCVMTLAYLLVAYLIYWCIKHWIPHSIWAQNCNNGIRGQPSSSKFCHCCLHRRTRHPFHQKATFIKSYAFLGQCDNFAPLVVPNPLMAVPSSPSQCSPTQSEEIPTEPMPTPSATKE